MEKTNDIRTMLKRLGIVIIVILCLYLVSRQADKNPDSNVGKSEVEATEKAKQPQRWNLIQKLLNEKIFIKVEKPAQFPHVYVGRIFYSLTFDEKTQFINVVWAYYKTENPRADIVVIKDGYSGKEIGKYAEVYGGLRMD